MKKIILFAILLLTITNLRGQNFNKESDVISYLNGKVFYNPDKGLEISYGYASPYGTYGIKIKNKYGNSFYFINVDIKTFGAFADVFGIATDDGKRFGFRLYRGRLIVGAGQQGAMTYFLK